MTTHAHAGDDHDMMSTLFANDLGHGKIYEVLHISDRYLPRSLFSNLSASQGLSQEEIGEKTKSDSMPLDFRTAVY